MDYYQMIAQVVDDLEDYSAIPVRLSELSQRYYLSYFHFSRIFQAVTHQTLKSYVDERRLNFAAQQLRSSHLRVVDIALESGFQSHEVFSRRFRQVFGFSPSQYRRAKKPPPLLPKAQIVARSLKQIGSLIAADYQLVEQPKIALMGQSCQFIAEEAGAFDRLTENAQAFVARYIVPDGIQRMYSVVTKQEDNQSGRSPASDNVMTCFTGREAEAVPLPGLCELSLPESRYAVFRYRGDICRIFETVFSDICITLMAAGLTFQKSGREFFNLYEGNYFQDGWFKIYVPVK